MGEAGPRLLPGAGGRQPMGWGGVTAEPRPAGARSCAAVPAKGLLYGIAPQVRSDFGGWGCWPGSRRALRICVEPSSGGGASPPGPARRGLERPRGISGRPSSACVLLERATPEPIGGLQVCSRETVSSRPASQPSWADARLEACLVASGSLQQTLACGSPERMAPGDPQARTPGHCGDSEPSGAPEFCSSVRMDDSTSWFP